MSRLILKDLPPQLNENKLRHFLSLHGTVTDFKPVYTESGKFRQFVFVGYQNEEDALRALKKINKTMIQNYSVKAEICKKLNTKKASTKLKSPTSIKGPTSGCQSTLSIDDKVRGNSKDLAFLNSKVQSTVMDDKKDIYDKKHNFNVNSNPISTNEVFIRNLSYTCKDKELRNLFEKFGKVTHVNIPTDQKNKTSVGYGFVTFQSDSQANTARKSLDGTIFQGRLLHVLPSKGLKNENTTQADQKISHWNSLFVGTNSVANTISESYNLDKSSIFDSTKKHSAAVHVALGEIQIVQETKKFLKENGVNLAAFSQNNSEKSDTTILAKNLPKGTSTSDLYNMFQQHTIIKKLLLAPSGVTAIIQCVDSKSAQCAFRKLAYKKLHHKPLYLEWAPSNTFAQNSAVDDNNESNAKKLFVKNLNFVTTMESLKSHFEQCGKVVSCSISTKRSNEGKLLSKGYGFVGYNTKMESNIAMNQLQNSKLDGHTLEIEISHQENCKGRESNMVESCTLLVRNVPFQATLSEIKSLFKSFGELKSVRLPKKINKDGDKHSHRGFAFVTFIDIDNARQAFAALVDSTHLYGRRLALEWAQFCTL